LINGSCTLNDGGERGLWRFSNLVSRRSDKDDQSFSAIAESTLIDLNSIIHRDPMTRDAAFYRASIVSVQNGHKHRINLRTISYSDQSEFRECLLNGIRFGCHHLLPVAAIAAGPEFGFAGILFGASGRAGIDVARGRKGRQIITCVIPTCSGDAIFD
jgi:hypothetical protein